MKAFLFFSSLLLSLLGEFFQIAAATTEADTRSTNFDICPRGFTRTSVQEEVMTAQSLQQCSVGCSGNDNCTGVNVCPGESGQEVKCSLTLGGLHASCDALSPAPSPQCFFVHKKVMCQNGGTLGGNGCECPRQYSGLTCGRLVRDCSEAFDNGQNDGTIGELEIHPIGAPAPFKVRCQYHLGGETIVFARTSSSNFNQDFATLKAGIGSDPMVDNYFIGLDNLHLLTSQADYELNFNVDDVSKLYDNFTFGPESSLYEINYSSYRESSAGDGFAYPPPMKFSAASHNPNCYYGRGSNPGWYSTAGCSGISVFTNAFLQWLDDNGATVNVGKILMKFVRRSQYYNV